MLRVGLTGNVASGKSAVAGQWRALGLEVVDADALARRAVAPGTEGLRRVVEAFGRGVLDPLGRLDRPAMAARVFRDAAERSRLEAIVHPEVQRLRAEAERAALERGLPLIVHEIPLLFETGIQDEFDVIVLVDAPVKVRAARMVRDRGMGPEQAARIIDAQMPSYEKRRKADIVIDNTADLETLRSRAVEVGRELQARAARAAAANGAAEGEEAE